MAVEEIDQIYLSEQTEPFTYMDQGQSKVAYTNPDNDRIALLPRNSDSLYDQTVHCLTWIHNAQTLEDVGEDIVSMPQLSVVEAGECTLPAVLVDHVDATQTVVEDALTAEYVQRDAEERQKMREQLASSNNVVERLYQQGEIAYASPAELDGELYAPDVMEMEVPGYALPPVSAGLDDYSTQYVASGMNRGYNTEAERFTVIDFGELTEEQFKRTTVPYGSQKAFVEAHGIDRWAEDVLEQGLCQR